MHRLDHIILGTLSIEVGTKFFENNVQTKLRDIGYQKVLQLIIG
tara:strand:+ start:231 stop:362 length:132 start_codon:yes stop_codon:yes gene_type:complete